MKLHNTAVNELIRLFETYGGYSHEKKLRQVLATIDFTNYQHQTGNTVLVLTEELNRKSRSR